MPLIGWKYLSSCYFYASYSLLISALVCLNLSSNCCKSNLTSWQISASKSNPGVKVTKVGWFQTNLVSVQNSVKTGLIRIFFSARRRRRERKKKIRTEKVLTAKTATSKNLKNSLTKKSKHWKSRSMKQKVKNKSKNRFFLHDPGLFLYLSIVIQRLSHGLLLTH